MRGERVQDRPNDVDGLSCGSRVSRKIASSSASMASSALPGQGDEGLPSVDPYAPSALGDQDLVGAMFPPGGAFSGPHGGTSRRRRCPVGTSAACNACAVSTMRLACSALSSSSRRWAAWTWRSTSTRSSSRISRCDLPASSPSAAARSANRVTVERGVAAEDVDQRLAVAGRDLGGELDGVVDRAARPPRARNAMCPTLLSAAQRSSSTASVGSRKVVRRLRARFQSITNTRREPRCRR